LFFKLCGGPFSFFLFFLVCVCVFFFWGGGEEGLWLSKDTRMVLRRSA